MGRLADHNAFAEDPIYRPVWMAQASASTVSPRKELLGRVPAIIRPHAMWHPFSTGGDHWSGLCWPDALRHNLHISETCSFQKKGSTDAGIQPGVVDSSAWLHL